MSRQPRYTLGEQVTIRGMRDGVKLLGEVTSLKPLKAKVIERDPVFEGAETTDGIRKINPQVANVRRRK